MSKKIGVVIHTSLREQIISDKDWQRLQSLGEVVATESPDKIDIEEGCRILADCEVGVGSWQTPAPCEEMMAACPKLGLWMHVAGSVKRFFGPHLEGHDLKVATCRMAIADIVAEHTIGCLIMGLKKVFLNVHDNRSGTARKADLRPKPLLCSKVGVVGYSQVGMRVVNLLKFHGADIGLYDPYVSEEQAKELGVTLFTDVTEMCAASDAMTLHTPAIPATEKMMGAAQFQAMPDDGVFVNTARGMCVDEDALIAELEKGRLMAILDVTAPEPAAPDSPFRSLRNCALTSHIAGNRSPNLGKQAVDEIERFIKGEPPIDIITTDMLDRIA